MKNAQMQHLFTFILVGVVLVATLVIGAKFLVTLEEKGCDAQEARLLENLEDITRTHDTFGTRQTVRLSTTCDATHLCIFSQESASGITITDATLSPSIKTQLEAAAQAPSPKPNVFLITQETLVDVGTFPSFVVPTGILCAKQQRGSFIFQTNGKGRTIEFSEAS